MKHLAELRKLVDALGLADRVELCGPVERSALAARYAQADAVLFPVEWAEPWGLVPLEAMSCGVPVIATGRGGSGEYLRDRENSLLFSAGDAGGLAAAVRELEQDAALRSRLIEGGRATAARFTEAAHNAGVLRELEQAASRAGSRTPR